MSPIADFSWIRLILALVTVTALLAAMAWALKYVGMHGMKMPGSLSKPRRLKLVEILPIDARRRVVIIRCDEREHLLLLSAGQDIVVETNLSPAPGDQ
jgi:flagellar protein FliO/FliZ